MRAQGLEGELRASYHVAARLGTWTLESVPVLPRRRYIVVTSVVALDTYWITQPLALVLRMGAYSWVWATARIIGRTESTLDLQVIDKPFITKEYPCPHNLLTSIPGSSQPKPSPLNSNGTGCRSPS